MAKPHGVEVAHVDRDQLLHAISFRRCQQQSVDVGETQLAVALQDSGRSLMVCLVCAKQFDSAFASPAQNYQGGFG